MLFSYILSPVDRVTFLKVDTFYFYNACALSYPEGNVSQMQFHVAKYTEQILY